MQRSWSDIREQAVKFSNAFATARHERGEAQTFWNSFFDLFGVERRRVAVYESAVRRLNKRSPGFMDLFWPGVVLVEHKSSGESLATAHAQAEEYFLGLKESEHPRFLVACDFRNFWLKDLESGTEDRFALSELANKVALFSFLLGREPVRAHAHDPINEKAVKKLARLHDGLRKDGYHGHPLQLLLVRILFCLFADRTGIFEPTGRFEDLIDRGTKEDGSDVGQLLTHLFDVLDTPRENRQQSLPGWLREFPHVNGTLFQERLITPSFSAALREILLECCQTDWSRISPAIFGSMFQRIVDMSGIDQTSDLRRRLGAHYTSEENILKVIGPLFLDELRAELRRASSSATRLFEFQKKLRRLRFLDPACGCGNFLVVTYRELRRLEIEVLKAAEAFGIRVAKPFEAITVDVDQFAGIEIEEFPAQVAQVAMFLMDHQMNIEGGFALDAWLPRIPLRQSARVRIGNALVLDWAELCPPGELDYIIGNPPFVGKQHQSDEQRADLKRVLATAGIRGGGVLDYVAAWYVRAGQYLVGSKASASDARRRAFLDAAFGNATQTDMLATPSEAAGRQAARDVFELVEQREQSDRAKVRVAFVSTSSICQGEQVAPLWGWLLKEGVRLLFAHRAFAWSNDASGKAAVHCVVAGLTVQRPEPPRLFDYEDPAGPAVELAVGHINPYLVDAPDVIASSRRSPLGRVPEITFGSMPNDGGHLLLSDDERAGLLAIEPNATPWIRRFLGADEFIYDTKRWCIWLVDCPPNQLSSLPVVRRRIAEVKAHRLRSRRPATKALASVPHLFGEIRQPRGRYLLIPRHSSEHRTFIPIGFVDSNAIAGDATLCIADAQLRHFGILSSRMHMAWVKHVCGRLESRYRYTNKIVYNNFPWPDDIEDPSSRHMKTIDLAAQEVLDSRARHPDANLAQLYDPNAMPADLLRAHAKLDAAVDGAYRYRGKKTDLARAAMLFSRYESITRNLGVAEADPENEPADEPEEVESE